MPRPLWLARTWAQNSPERAEQSVWRTGLYNVIFLGTIGVFFLFFATPAVKYFD